MSSTLLRSFLLGALGVAATCASFGQAFNPGWDMCENPSVPNPHSPDYSVAEISEAAGDHTPLFQTSLGHTGSTQFAANCPIVTTYNVSHSGRFGFGSGSVGSVQTSKDDLMLYTFGMPDDPGNTFGYAVVTVGGTPDKPQTKFPFGSGQWSMFFRGESDRYIICENGNGQVDVKLNIDVLGDAARYQWTIKNQSNGVVGMGFWSGCFLALIDNPTTQTPPNNYKGWVNSNPAQEIFVAIPGQRPTRLETRWTRKANPAVYPAYFDFDWSQSQPYGLRIETGPSSSTTDPITQVSDATQSDEFELGQQNLLLGDPNTTTGDMPDAMFPFVHNEPGIQQSDITYTSNPAYIMKYFQQAVAPGGTRTIVQYYRDTWGQSNYASPYTVVVDAPKLFNYDPNGVNGLTPNPATVRVWVDNIKGFTSAEQTVPLENVRVTLDLTQTQGIAFIGGGKQQTKTIAKINSRDIGFVDFTVQADGVTTGVQPMTVTVVAPPGPTKTIVAMTDISTTPKIPVVPGANLVTMPWQFADTSWTAILGLTEPTQFQAFEWDPIQQGYVLSTSSQRGKGTWLVIQDQSVIPTGTLTLQSDPQRPPDMQTGADVLQLQRGWNLIGNPYPYPVPLGDLVGVSAGDPTKTYKWLDMVDAGFVSGALAYWDTTTSPPGYKFISGTDALMQPNLGYWIFVNDLGLTLSFPPVFYEGAITSPTATSLLKSRTATRAWVQSDSQWRLQLAARTNNEIDDQNFVGVAASAKAAQELKIYEPPMGPTQNLGVSIAPDKTGDSRLAQSLLTTTTAEKWTVDVQVKKGGEVTLTWPNMTTVPKNVMFKIVDVATGTSRDMRRTSGYTFTAGANSTREFTVQAQPGTASRAIIGNVVIGHSTKDRNAPFTISYTLSADAITTVRILGAGGREVFTATRGRADSAGENTATWAMRDNANRAVAPGIYRVEITAETSDGERVRKIVPINVIR